jgi:hypothetical protein
MKSMASFGAALLLALTVVAAPGVADEFPVAPLFR